MKFQPGQSGNPAGRGKGVKNKHSELIMQLEPHAVEIIAKLVELAKNGDLTAIKICIERLLPKLNEPLVSIELPELPLDSVKNLSALSSIILQAVTDNELTPTQGQAMTAMIVANCKIIETYQLESRVAEIEYQLNKREEICDEG